MPNILEISREQLLKLAARTVETYPPEWLVVNEALQNALDAIQKSDVSKGQVNIILDLSKESVTVEDNGKGFPHDIKLLGMGGTDKDADPDVWKLGGNQGVGIKAVLFCTSYFELESRVSDKLWRITAKDGYKYRSNNGVDLVPSDITESRGENYTKVSYSFPSQAVSEFVQLIYDNYFYRIDDRLADDPVSKFKLAVEYYFRAHSYAGDVNRLLGLAGVKPIKITLTVRCKNKKKSLSNELAKILLDAGGQLVVEFENKFWDIREIVGRTKKRMPRPRIVESSSIPESGRVGRYGPGNIWISVMTTKEHFYSLLKNPALRKRPDVGRYEKLLFDRITGIYIVIGALRGETLRPYIVEDPAQFIAASGVPTKHLIQNPTITAGYLEPLHFIVNVKEKPNYGKQMISNMRLVGMINEFFRDAYSATLRNLVSNVVGREKFPPTTSADDVEQIEEIETKVLARNDIGLKDLSFIKEPYDENAVIAIFYELIGRGYLKGYRTYTLSSKTPYDGMGVMKLAGQTDFPQPKRDSDLKFFEFKLRLSQLLEDFAEARKDPRQLTLIVVWEDDFSAVKDRFSDYEVVDIEYTSDADRAMDGVMKCLDCKEHRRQIQMLVLKEFIEAIQAEKTSRKGRKA